MTQIAGRITKVKINDGDEKIYSIETPIPDFGGGAVKRTIESGAWQNRGDFFRAQVVVEDVMKESITPIIDLDIQPTLSSDTYITLIEDWSNVYSAESRDNYVYLYSLKKIEHDLNIIIKW